MNGAKILEVDGGLGKHTMLMMIMQETIVHNKMHIAGQEEMDLMQWEDIYK